MKISPQTGVPCFSAPFWHVSRITQKGEKNRCEDRELSDELMLLGLSKLSCRISSLQQSFCPEISHLFADIKVITTPLCVRIRNPRTNLKLKGSVKWNWEAQLSYRCEAPRVCAQVCALGGTESVGAKGCLALDIRPPRRQERKTKKRVVYGSLQIRCPPHLVWKGVFTFLFFFERVFLSHRWTQVDASWFSGHSWPLSP